jgi:hypothetical protein
LHQILGDMDDSTAVAILALHPSVAQVEEARVWLNGGGDVLGKELAACNILPADE